MEVASLLVLLAMFVVASVLPVNLGVTSTAEGLRASLTLGWNLSR